MGGNGASGLGVDPDQVSVQEADIQTGPWPFHCRSVQRSDSIAFPKCRGAVPPAARPLDLGCTRKIEIGGGHHCPSDWGHNGIEVRAILGGGLK